MSIGAILMSGMGNSTVSDLSMEVKRNQVIAMQQAQQQQKFGNVGIDYTVEEIASLRNAEQQMITAGKDEIASKEVSTKSTAAITALKDIFDGVNFITSRVNGWKPHLKERLSREIGNGVMPSLESIAAALNKPYAAGKYVFSPSDDCNQPPVNEWKITHGTLYLEDGSSSDDYLVEVDRFEDGEVYIGEGVTLPANFNAGDLKDLISALQQIRDIMNSDTQPDSLPVNMVTKLNTGKAALERLLHHTGYIRDTANRVTANNNAAFKQSALDLNSMSQNSNTDTILSAQSMKDLYAVVLSIVASLIYQFREETRTVSSIK